MSLLVEILTAVAIFFVEASIHLLSLVFSSTWLATRTKGATRISYCATALTASHLLAGILLVFFDISPAFLMSALYSKAVIILSLVVLLFSIVLPISLTRIVLGTPSRPVDNEESGNSGDIYLVSVFLAIAVIFGLITFATTQPTRKSLKQELCEAAHSKVGDNWIGKGSKALQWIDGHTDKDLSKLRDCLDSKTSS
jgi:formate hydrogenlyase subunit 3/multisubunit Na+/H+ antiporter MnhD subunit